MGDDREAHLAPGGPEVIPRRPRVIFDGLIPITAGGVAVGAIPGDLLECVINLAEGGPLDRGGEPLSTEEVLLQVQRAITPRPARALPFSDESEVQS